MGQGCAVQRLHLCDDHGGSESQRGPHQLALERAAPRHVGHLRRWWMRGSGRVAASYTLHQQQQQQQQHWCELPARLRSAKLTPQQLAVFGAGDAAQALTLTANGGVVRSAAQAGVHLETMVHAPVWLTGL